MSFIDLYEKIDARIKELMDDGKDEDEARELAWEEFHEKIQVSCFYITNELLMNSINPKTKDIVKKIDT